LGEGKLNPRLSSYGLYSAARKPTPNVATVVYSHLEEEECPDYDHSKGECYIWCHRPINQKLRYSTGDTRATGSDGPVGLFGRHMQPRKPFTVTEHTRYSYFRSSLSHRPQPLELRRYNDGSWEYCLRQRSSGCGRWLKLERKYEYRVCSGNSKGFSRLHMTPE